MSVHVCGRNTQHYRYDAPSAALPAAEDVLDPSDLRVATSLPNNPSSPIEFPPALRATTTTPPADNRRCLPTTTFAVYP